VRLIKINNSTPREKSSTPYKKSAAILSPMPERQGGNVRLMIFLAGSPIKSERKGVWRLEVGGAGDDSAVCPASDKICKN